MINVGITGVGFMGWIHWLAYQQVDGIKVTAIASSDPAKRAGDWSAISGNFGPPGTQVDLSEVAVYESLEQMLADDSIDVVDICLPTQFHASAIEKAFGAGKHVFCEKPLGLSVAACDAAIEQSARADRMLVVGHVLPWFAEFEFALQAIQSGRYGKLKGASFKRVVAEPAWADNYWDRSKVGGPLLDLHVHDAHLMRVLFGMPKTCYSAGSMRSDVPEFFHSIFGFEDANVTVLTTCGAIDQQTRPFCHGYAFYLDDAMIEFDLVAYDDSAETVSAKIIPTQGDPIPLVNVDADPVNAFARLITEVRDTISTGRRSEMIDGRLAGDAVAICESVAASMMSGRVEDVLLE